MALLADLVQNTLDGIALGSSYALLALGFTLIFGVLRRANLAYGRRSCSRLRRNLGQLEFQNRFVVLAATTVLATVLAGVYVERLCFAPHRKGAAAAAMVASFALWMQFEELATLALPQHLYPSCAL